ncbi:hypothetical protein A3768_3619 [Ralstonia solanacearum]|nr:hypothetical protein A3768_3619 [Ralstonia solanacearum]
MPVRCNAPRNGLDCSGIPRCAAGAGACQWR